MLFEGDIAKGVLSQDQLSELLAQGKIEFPIVTVEEIQDRSKGDGFSNRSPLVKPCGSSYSALQEEPNISTSLS